MRDEDCYLRLEEQRRRELLEEVHLERMLHPRRSTSHFLALREKLGDLLIETGYRLKAAEDSTSPRKMTTEGSH